MRLRRSRALGRAIGVLAALHATGCIGGGGHMGRFALLAAEPDAAQVEVLPVGRVRGEHCVSTLFVSRRPSFAEAAKQALGFAPGAEVLVDVDVYFDTPAPGTATSCARVAGQPARYR